MHLEGEEKAVCTGLTRFGNVALRGDQSFMGKLDLGYSISEDFLQFILLIRVSVGNFLQINFLQSLDKACVSRPLCTMK